MEYKFSGSLTIREYIQGCRLLNRRREIFFIIFLFIVLLSLIFSSYNFTELKEYLIENPLNIFIIIWHKYFIKYYLSLTLLFIIEYFVINPIFYIWHYKSDKMINVERNFCITKEFITMYSEYINLKITKEKIRKIIFTKNTIYIFTSITSIININKRYLGDDNKFNELKMFINENFNMKKVNSI